MLPRAALRATRARVSASTPTRILASTPIRSPPGARTFADRSRPPPPRPSSKQGKAQPSRPLPAASGAARQTSPGTSFPKDETWKPQDGIKLGGGVAAATASGAGQQATGNDSAVQSESAATPVDGSRPDEPITQASASPLEGGGKQQEPLAQKLDADAPIPGTIREETQDKQAVSENTPPPPEPPAVEIPAAEPAQEPIAQQVDADAPAPGTIREHAHEQQAAAENTPPPPESPVEPAAPGTPQQPLPDLRFGIPSTLDFEMGQKKGGEATSGGDAQQQQSDNFDLTSAPPETQERREREEREYDRSAYETSLDRQRARLMNYVYASLLGGVVAGCLLLSRPYSSTEEKPANLSEEDAFGWAPGKLYARVRARLGNQVGYYTEPSFPQLLPEVPENQRPPFTLVLSLEDLMVHSSWDRKHGYRTAKRPGIDYFIRYLSQYYELVLFTSAPITFADPVIRKLDPYHFIMWPLGREATKYEGGEYVKDLSYLNRPLNKTLVIDTHAPHLKNQPENAIILPKWSGDPKDPHTKDLVALIPFLEYVATMGIDDVRQVLKSFEGKSIPEEFARREAEARAKFNAQLAQEKRGRPSFGVGSLASGLGIKGSSAAAGGMVLADGQSVAEGLAQGKMLSDQIREQGQKQYEFLEKQIRENGAQWLKEEEEEQKKMLEASMRDTKAKSANWVAGWFGGSGGDNSGGASPST